MPTPWSTRPMRSSSGGRAIASVILAVLLAGAVTGCGTQRVKPQASGAAASPSAIYPSPSANDYVSAIIGTQSMGTAKLAIDLTTQAAGVDRTLHAEGAGVLDPGWADLRWTGDGSTTREMVNDQGIFVQNDPPDGRWTHFATNGDAPRTTPTSGSADPLRSLETLRDVTIQGPESLDGVDTMRFVGTLPASTTELVALGLSKEQIAAVGALPSDARVDVTLWFDSAEHVIRVDRLLNLGATTSVDLAASTTTTLSDFSSMIDMTSPTSTSVDQAAAAT